MKIDNGQEVFKDGDIVEDYSGLSHRGKNETQDEYKARRHHEKMQTKHRGRYVHVSKLVRPDRDKDKADPENKHFTIDGDGSYVNPKKKE
jgi:hypothetical protein